MVTWNKRTIKRIGIALVVIPFQFGYAVNLICESYIVIPAFAGIHTGWLGRTW